MVYILEKESNRIVIGHLLVDRGLNHRFSTLIPRDHRFPKLLVNTSTWPVPINLKEGTRESKELFYAILPNWDNFKIPMGYGHSLIFLAVYYYKAVKLKPIYFLIAYDMKKFILNYSADIFTKLLFEFLIFIFLLIFFFLKSQIHMYKSSTQSVLISIKNMCYKCGKFYQNLKKKFKNCFKIFINLYLLFVK